MAVPGKQHIWLTLVIGVFAAFLGTLLAAAIGVDDTGGTAWIESAIQVAFAAGGVSIAAAVMGRHTTH